LVTFLCFIATMATPYFAVTGQKPIIVKTDEVQEVQIQPHASGTTFFDRLSPRKWVSPSNTNNNPWSFPSSAPPLNRRCQDLFWALLFYAHLFGIAYCTYTYSPRFLSDFRETTSYAQQMQYYNPHHTRRELEQNFNDDDSDLELDIDPHALLIVMCIGTVMSLVFSTCALGFMMSYAEVLVKVAVYFNVALFGCLFLLAMLVHAYGLAVIFLLLTAVMTYYINRVWSRIPFAAANLVTAVTAVRANLGLAIYAYVSVVLVFLWSLWWSLASLSTIYVTSGCQVNGNCDSEVNGAIMFAFLLSYYWTIQVLTNVVHCTTAGTVATWWHDPVEANGCCSTAVRDSYLRSLTYNFGSICLASLIVAIVETIREILHGIRENGDGLIVCVVDCLISCIESFVELFNRFALIYCAVHGQSFLAAARSVMDLFRARGWTAIITDLMVDTCLSMMNIGVGLLVGLLCLIIAGALHGSGAMLSSGFGIGFLVGYAVCAVLFSVVSSAVNAVIVCYAEAPNDFQRNHLELSKQMRNAWRLAWPNDFSY
jgi:Plasma-membrane choline transporter